MAPKKRRSPRLSPQVAERLPQSELAIVKIRVTDSELRRLRLAAALSDRSHTVFVLSAAMEKADSLLRDAGLKQYLEGVDA